MQRQLKHKSVKRSPWLLKLLNGVLVLLLMFQGLLVLQKLLPSHEEPSQAFSLRPDPRLAADDQTAPPTPALNAYRAIWERNLFNAGDGKTGRLQETIAPTDIPAVDETLKLKLIGTVVDSSGSNFAIILDPQTGSQTLFHEGDQIYKMIVKKILRHRVIVATADGNRLLAMNDNQAAEAYRSPRSQASMSEPAAIESDKVALQINPDPKEFRRENVEAYLVDTDQVLREVEISPFKRFNQSVGIRFDDIPPENILAELGLHSGDVIVGVNDLNITGPNQAAELFRALTQEGEVTIMLQRRLSVHRLRLKII